MIVVYNNTNIKLEIKVTNNNFCLKESDLWCLVNLSVNNKEFDYNINKEIITLQEVKSTINIIDDFLCNKIKAKRISYIKNFIKIKLNTYKKNKYLELILIEPKDIGNNSYKIILNESEIIKINKLLKKVL